MLYDTDKGPSGHGYTRLYHKYFEPLRRRTLNLLELGWGGHENPDEGGASALMWRKYFPNANIVVVDIEPKNMTSKHEGITLFEGSQDDADLVNDLVEIYGGFDIVIDDASHVSSLTIKSFELLFPHLYRGGFYVVEDLHSSYHPWYYGETEANEDPNALTANGNETAMQYFQRIIHDVNYHGDGDWDQFPARYYEGNPLEYMHFYFDILFMKKRVNA